MADHDDDKSGLPFAVYVVIGVLAIIGAISIFGIVLSAIRLVFRLAFIAFVVIVVVSLLRAVFRRQAA